MAFQPEAEGPAGPRGGGRPVSFVRVNGLYPGPGPNLTCSPFSGKRWVHSLLLLQDLLPAPPSAPWSPLPTSPPSCTGLPSLGPETRPGSLWGAQSGEDGGWGAEPGLAGPPGWPVLVLGLINSERGFQRPLDLPHQAAPVSLSEPRDWKKKPLREQGGQRKLSCGAPSMNF